MGYYFWECHRISNPALDVTYPGHEGVGLVPGLLVQLVALEALGALGDGGPVHLNLTTASVIRDLTLLHDLYSLLRKDHLSAARGGS